VITGRPHPSLSPGVDQHVSGFQNAQEEKATNVVTGGTGFIGSCLAKMILDEDLDVATFDIKPTSPVLDPYGSRWRHFRGDLRDMSDRIGSAIGDGKSIS